MTAAEGAVKRPGQCPNNLRLRHFALILFKLALCSTGAAAGMRELLLESSPSSPSLPQECTAPHCRQYGDLRLHLKPHYCSPPPPRSPGQPRPSRPPAGLAPPPGSPGFQPAPITAYCGAPPRIIASGDTCASIVKLFALPSVDFLQRINPTLNCSSPKVGLSLCVNKFSQWAIPNCRRFITLWDGDSCQSVISANAATLLYGYDDLMYCNGGLNCNYLLRGMVVCVSCV